ncbi:hypothetical protein EVAR_16781_1 [Eumeta japonica]|uniref:Uncharacterized protein n=1 Tax=Eumeta variegata TaxID=151549 RepID=A0A4C1ULR1_EUMVA|nr:hypothetical protein EVAR_16781_1 [Eumeta japonica]
METYGFHHTTLFYCNFLRVSSTRVDVVFESRVVTCSRFSQDRLQFDYNSKTKTQARRQELHREGLTESFPAPKSNNTPPPKAEHLNYNSIYNCCGPRSAYSGER